MIVHDIDRPDVGGVAPKMTGICEMAKDIINIDIPVLNITTNDNLGSSTYVWGSLTKREEWPNKIYENSAYFSFTVTPAKRQRYYEGGDVTVKLCTANYKLPKFRQSTTTPEKAIKRILKWIQEC